MQHHWSRYAILVWLLLAVGAAGLLAGGVTAQAQQTPTLTVSPAQGTPGETVTIAGTGWPAGASIVVRLYEAGAVGGPSATLGGAIEVGPDGTFTQTGTIPPTLFGSGNRGNLTVVPGDYVVVASGVPEPMATVPFRVTAPAGAALIWGVVFYDGNGNSALDPGESTANAQVSIVPQNQASPVPHLFTDARGRFVSPPLEPGTYSVFGHSEATGEAWTGSIVVTVTAGQATRFDLPLHTGPVPPPADERYFAPTGYRIDNDAIWEYFRARGGINTFGYPVSRTFRLLGFPVQVFQRHVLQVWPDGSVHPLNLLDPGLLPVTTVNFATFPAHNPGVATAAPPPSAPSYGQAVSDYLARTVPNVWTGLPVNFYRAYLAAAPTDPGFAPLVALEVWGFPTSLPERDPNNASFVYQRFQRGILHFDATTGFTGGILLADAFKAVLLGSGQPTDLAEQARGSRFFNQYCPNNPRWLCRPEELPDTDLTLAFQPLPQPATG